MAMPGIEYRSVSCDIWKEVADIVGEENLSKDLIQLASYSRDIWTRKTIEMQMGNLPAPPQLVVWPQTVDQVQRLVRFAAGKNIPIIPLGAASGVCGGTIALKGGITIDLKKMNRIRNLDRKSMLAEIEAGAVGEVLERELNHQGYTLGHFPSSIYCSSFGGWVATRGAGQLSSRYGKIEDMVSSVEVVLPNGELLRTRAVPRSSTGPSLNHIFIGSEGTLGIITAATVRLWDFPKAREFQGFMFPDLHQGLDAIRLMMQSELKPAVIRLYDPVDTYFSSKGTLEEKPKPKKLGLSGNRGLVRFARKVLPYIYSPGLPNRFLQSQAKASKMILIFEGEPEIVAMEHRQAKEICSRSGGIDLGEWPARNWWKHRYRVSYTMSKVFDLGFFVDTIEVATVWDNLENLYYSMQAAISKHALVMAHFSHAYPQGCSIYFSIAASGRSLEDRLATYDSLWKDALDACMQAGGSLSHHHGIGILKAKWMETEEGGANPLLKALKRAVDPHGIMNPGKMGI
jgi:alkyldihydroxyacetonephosphate synthase